MQLTSESKLRNPYMIATAIGVLLFIFGSLGPIASIEFGYLFSMLQSIGLFLLLTVGILRIPWALENHGGGIRSTRSFAIGCMLAIFSVIFGFLFVISGYGIIFLWFPFSIGYVGFYLIGENIDWVSTRSESETEGNEQ